MSARLVSFVVAAGAFVTGCESRNPYFCPGANPNDNCAEVDAADDGPKSCSSNGQCAVPKAVCDLTETMTCVQCTTDQASACSATTPVCSADHACRGCTAHAQCGSNACLPDGSCGDDSKVAYVDPAGTDNASCTKAMPCTKVAKAQATGKAFIKFHGTTDEAVSINNANVTLLADPGAKLTRSSVGVVLKVDGTSVVSIYDLDVADGPGGTGVGISMPTGNTATLTLERAKVTNNAGGGIVASAGSLVVRRSVISGNTAGGISITSAQFDLANNIIAKNGSVSTAYGGVLLSQANTGTRRMEFNTIASNGGSTGATTGVVCALVTQAVTFSNNIVYGNQVSSGGTQVGGTNCSWTYSDVGPDTVAGAGNIAADPTFVNVAQNNFHLMGTSPAKDVADPNATLAIDLDGDVRPQGSGRDMGADEYRP